MESDFFQLYSAEADFVYALCFALEGDVEVAERLFAEVWKAAYQSFPEPGEPVVVLGRHLSSAFRRGARGPGGAAEGDKPTFSVAVGSLAPEYRLPLLLKDGHGLSYEQIAAALDIPQPTVRARVARGRTLLGSRLGLKAASTPLDEELLSAYLDRQLEVSEALAVEGLLRDDAAWRDRLEQFRANASALRQLPKGKPSARTRDIVFRSVTESFALGAERRRVPRYKRRWMLLAAFAVPCLLTLLYLQNPTRDSRLYLRPDGLLPRAGRSGPKTALAGSHSWVSPRLWGRREAAGDSSLSYQVDAGEGVQAIVRAEVVYDFDGDGEPDRIERYEPSVLDQRAGWQRCRPKLETATGDFADFRGGSVTVSLESSLGEALPLELSGSAGELVLPYRRLDEGDATL